MILVFEYYLLTVLEQCTPNFGALNYTAIFNSAAPEILLYFGIIINILLLAINFNSNLNTKFELINNYCKFFYSATLILLSLQWVFLILDSKVNTIVINQFFKVDFYSQTLKIFILLMVLVFSALSPEILTHKKLQNIAELHLLIYISICLGFIIISCTNFALLLLTLEGFSLILYILTTIDRSYGGVIAAVKYFSFGTLGSILLFWGVVHIYALVPSLAYSIFNFTLDFANISNHLQLIQSTEFIAVVITIGFLIKLGAAPIHQWVPDVYSGVPMVITLFFATVVKFILFIVFCQITYHLNTGAVLDFFAACSLLVGAISTLRQLEIKRFLAYSSITHVGFLLIGDLNSVLLYIFTYIISSLLFFSILLSSRSYNREIIYLTDLRFFKNGGNWNAFLLVISVTSMAGLPPFAGFFGKFLIWNSLVEDIYLFNNYSSYFILILSIILTLVTIFYYMRLISYLYASNADEVTSIKNITSVSKNSVQIQVLLLILILGWIFFHPIIINIIMELAKTIII